MRVDVFEADSVVGGLARTVEYNGYRFDIGGHRFFTKVQGVQALWRSMLGEDLVRVGVHVLRHTFCSHLAMRGAPARAIQELAGYQELGTTQRYMHLSPAALESAIRLPDTHSRGDILETAVDAE